jgi:hypothetical protein
MSRVVLSNSEGYQKRKGGRSLLGDGGGGPFLLFTLSE